MGLLFCSYSHVQKVKSILISINLLNLFMTHIYEAHKNLKDSEVYLNLK